MLHQGHVFLKVTTLKKTTTKCMLANYVSNFKLGSVINRNTSRKYMHTVQKQTNKCNKFDNIY